MRFVRPGAPPAPLPCALMTNRPGGRMCNPKSAFGILTSVSFEDYFAAEVASTSAGKAEPKLTEVIFTSAPKPRAVRRLGCPHLVELR